MLSESAVSFNDDVSPSGGAPEIVIPLEENKISLPQQRMRTFRARSSVNLKEDILEKKEFCTKKMSGKKRGKYNVCDATKNQDEIDFVLSAFEGKVNVDGEDFLLLVGGGPSQQNTRSCTCTSNTPRHQKLGSRHSSSRASSLPRRSRKSRRRCIEMPRIM